MRSTEGTTSEMLRQPAQNLDTAHSPAVQAAPAQQEQPIASRAGPEMLMAEVSHTLNNVEKLTVERIDELINRLQNLKHTVILENKASLEKVASFIDLVESGIGVMKPLEQLVSQLETAAVKK